MTVFRHSGLTTALKRGAVLVPVSVAVALAGCANADKAKVDASTTSSLPPPSKPMTQKDFADAVSYWGERYQKNPKDKDVALNYAAALRRTGSSDQAVAVLQATAIKFPNDHDVLAAYGKALADAGMLQQALEAIRRAETADKPDWKLISAEAAILDQMGQHGEARKLYEQALGLAPDDPTVLSNYGMSYVLTGELDRAEELLRKAITAPGADSRVRQNLALVVGLQGRFDEAKKIASAELSPEQAAANIAYLKQMLAQQNNWQQLKAGTTPNG
jgi:Flp pilus assembly protein TadD